MPTVLIVVVVVSAIVVLAAIVVRSRRSSDGVDSFRRQIDALSPEARRPVVDQVQNAAGRVEQRPDEDPPDSTEDEGDPDGS